MNAVLWLLHLGVVWYSLPLLRSWWRGERWEVPPEYGPSLFSSFRRPPKRWAVVLSVCMPPIAALWLIPLAIGHRWRQQEAGQRLREAERRALRAKDVAFWREQVATGDLISAWVGMELLAMWGVPLIEPERPAANVVPVITSGRGELISNRTGEDWVRQMENARELIRSGLTVPQALPGAHEYSHGCDCRNCVRARAADPRWRGSGPLVPSEEFCRRCGATSRAEMCTIRLDVCGHL